MAHVRRRSWVVWFALGTICGLLATGFWPNTPLHAVATDHSDTCVMATGMVDDSVEAVFLLDFLTGTLRGAVISNQSRGFQAVYETNVLADLAASVTALNVKVKAENVARKKQGAPARPDVQLPQSPKFLMVTGISDLRRGAARLRPGRSVVYVAEVSTGLVLAYVVPWSPEQHSNDIAFQGKMILWAADQFATTVVRPE